MMRKPATWNLAPQPSKKYLEISFGLDAKLNELSLTSAAAAAVATTATTKKVNLRVCLYLMLLQIFILNICLAGGDDHESSSVGGGWKELKRRPYLRSALLSSSSSHTKRVSPIERLRSSRTTYLYDGYKNKKKKPNIILFVTDDQDVELGSLNFMPETSRLIREGGAEFRHAYATTPMCCPSRSSMLTGLYVHNHNVYTNNDNCSNSQWQMEHETRSFATYLHTAGYHTGYFGKYLNKYNGSHIPPGWREWAGLIMNSKYYNYSINLNGKRVRHGNDYSKDYYTDLIANDSVNFLRQWKSENADKPTLLVMSFPAPHGPEDSAPQFSRMFFNVTSHHTPAYDYAPNPDKQWILRVTDKMLPIHKRFTDLLMTKRLQTLQSVDSAVKRVYDLLKETGELENTFMIYTSDHGYHLGQFGLIKGKSFPFEFDVRIPFLVRGPGIEPGSIVNEMALNIDLAPTILDIADVEIPHHMDGRSLVKLFNRRRKNVRKFLSNWPDTFLIESSGRRDLFAAGSNSMPNKVSSWSTENIGPSTSSSFSSEESSAVDSLPLASSTGDKNLLVDETNTKSASVIDLTKNDFSLKHVPSIENTTSNIFVSSKAERLSLECQQAKYSYPCVAGQKWFCVQKQNRWRRHKCRFLSPEEISLQALQKCTCVTEDGIVYLRFQAVNGQNEHNSGIDNVHPTIIHYLKSNKSSDELVNELAKTWQIMRRHRRSSNRRDHTGSGTPGMTPVMDLVDGQMVELPLTSSRSNTTTCMVMYDDSVQCSPEIYDSPVLLQLGKEQLILEIRKLQLQIRKLKNIHRHFEKKHSALINVNNNINEENVGLRGSETVNVNSSTHEDSRNHKHRHQRIELSRNTNKVMYPQYNEHRSETEGDDGIVPDSCYCIPHSQVEHNISESEENIRNQKQLLREQKKKRKEKKLKKKAKLEKECFQEKMNCFTHDSQHWRTPPSWNDDPFCFCMNANNNTYTCLRTINATHNFLYCEFVTGWITYYNLRIDPFQQWNRFHSLSTNEKIFLKSTLSRLSKCKGSEECGNRSRNSNAEFLSLSRKISATDRKNQSRNLTYQAA